MRSLTASRVGMPNDTETPPPPEVAPAPQRVVLSPVESVAIVDHINRKAVAKDDACPVCGSPANTVISDVYRLPVLTDSPAFGGAYQPIVTTVCNNCGFVRMFNRLVVERLIQNETGVNQVTAAAEPNNGD